MVNNLPSDLPYKFKSDIWPQTFISKEKCKYIYLKI